MTALRLVAGPLPPERFVRVLARLGPTSTKVGQFLALRPDLLPQEYCDALLALVDRGTPCAWPQIEQVLTRELGGPPGTVFARFERRPIGVGSLSQVHRATLQGGAEVAVKILRPGIEAQIERDIRRLRLGTRLVRQLGLRLPIAPGEAVDEIAAWLRQEIDLAREQENARRMADDSVASDLQVIPHVYPHLSTARILTYQYLDGRKLSTVFSDRSGIPSGTGGSMAMSAEDKRAFAGTLVTAVLTQIFRARFFHADLHPGNLLVMADGRVGFVDFGMCDRLDDTVRANQLRYVAAVYSRDQNRMFRALTEILVTRADSDAEGLRRDFQAETRAAANSDRVGRSATAGALVGVLRAARANRYEVPSHVLSLYRALVTVETVAARLGLDNALRDIGAEVLGEIQREELLAQALSRDTLQQILANLLTLARDGPGQLSQVLADAAEGSVRLKVEVTDSARTAKAQNRRARLWAAAILSVGLSILLTAPHLPIVLGMSLAWPLGGALAGLYLACFLLWRQL
ncbi:ABC1 kinase family protein [Sphingomonas sp. TDK1]|uniref:ABC1 kinase family protein n=1 Tax=Sphingomonas sp. TDK1 TaxID=453247 RepID=UPI0007D9DD45|nr:AarF/UbiB family protein [Sphingomonas sp. TDK1]OAN67118.1 hypothetical protein A7X12_00350 [Sphingomonas sp. TDK1]